MFIATSTPMPIPVEFTDATVEHLVSQAGPVDEAQKEQYRGLVQATLSQVNVTLKRKQTVDEFIIQTASATNMIEDRLRVIQSVAKNTLRKMTHGHPPELNWVKNNRNLQFIGFFTRKSSWNGRSEYSNITHDIAASHYKMRSVKKDVIVRFSVIDSYTRSTIIAEIPAEFLCGDPMMVSQYVRKLCRQHALDEENRLNKDIVTRLANLQKEYEANLAKLERERASNENYKPIKSKRKPVVKKPVTV